LQYAWCTVKVHAVHRPPAEPLRTPLHGAKSSYILRKSCIAAVLSTQWLPLLQACVPIVSCLACAQFTRRCMPITYFLPNSISSTGCPFLVYGMPASLAFGQGPQAFTGHHSKTAPIPPARWPSLSHPNGTSSSGVPQCAQALGAGCSGAGASMAACASSGRVHCARTVRGVQRTPWTAARLHEFARVRGREIRMMPPRSTACYTTILSASKVAYARQRQWKHNFLDSK
jgi:hypothetical protein